MGRVKKGKPRRERPLPGLGPGERIVWHASPARAIVGVPDDPEAQLVAGAWRYWLVNPNGSRIETSVAEHAQGSGESLVSTAGILVDLEEAGFSSWDGPSNELRMSLGPQEMRSAFGGLQ